MSAMYGAQHVLNFPKALRNGSMTDFEIAIDDAIVTWYHSYQYEGDYFDNRRWDQLYEEQKKIAAQLFWQEMLS